MRMLKNRLELIVLLLVAILVPFIFVSIHPKPLAALVAGTLFNLMAIVLLVLAWKQKGLTAQLFKAAVGIFLVVFSIPIMAERVLHWGEEFSTLSWWGFTADQWHHSSTYMYWVLVVLSVAMKYPQQLQKSESIDT